MPEVRMRVWRVEPHSPSQYLLILLDEDQRLLPMTIGLCEAMAIQGMLQSDRGIPRPTTAHDLMGELITGLGGRVVKVVIDDLWNKVYFAKLHIAVNGEIVTVDSGRERAQRLSRRRPRGRRQRRRRGGVLEAVAVPPRSIVARFAKPVARARDLRLPQVSKRVQEMESSIGDDP